MRSSLIAEGKTKQIWTVPEIVRIKSKNDITAGDGVKHDTFEGKAAATTEFNCNCMELLARHNVPVAYIVRLSPTEFLAHGCTMLPYEVVIRSIALGSILKREPGLKRGDRFDPLRVEFYLKTSEKNFRGIALEKDDPLIINRRESGLTVVRPDEPVTDNSKRVEIPRATMGWGLNGDSMDPFALMEGAAVNVFTLLSQAWSRRQKLILGDLKIEFGRTSEARLVVADVIDQDSGRILTQDLVHLDKQRYRDGEGLEKVRSLYDELAEKSKTLL